MPITSKDLLRQKVYAAMFGALTAVGAYISIPLQPVPITLQDFFTFLAATLLGGYTGALSQVIYILLGIIGLPVFAGGKAGIGVLLGPTGGYLLGYIIGAFVIGKIVQMRKEPGWAWIIMASLIGLLIIYTVGAIQLSLVAKLSLAKTLLVGVVPFIPGDLCKLLLATVVYLKLSKYLHPILGKLY
jgi:biotin transport system substrate-specific component